MSGILGPSGLPIRQQRGISDAMLQQIFASFQDRMDALAGQQVNIGLLLEFTNNQLIELFPDFEIDQEEFKAFRSRRWKEMQEQSKQIQEDLKASNKAADKTVDKALDEAEMPSLENMTPVEIPGLDLT